MNATLFLVDGYDAFLPGDLSFTCCYKSARTPRLPSESERKGDRRKKKDARSAPLPRIVLSYRTLVFQVLGYAGNRSGAPAMSHQRSHIFFCQATVWRKVVILVLLFRHLGVALYQYTKWAQKGLFLFTLFGGAQIFCLADAQRRRMAC